MFFSFRPPPSPRSNNNLQYTTNWVSAPKPTGFSIIITTEILISYLSTEILAAASIILGLGCQHAVWDLVDQCPGLVFLFKYGSRVQSGFSDFKFSENLRFSDYFSTTSFQFTT